MPKPGNLRKKYTRLEISDKELTKETKHLDLSLRSLLFKFKSVHFLLNEKQFCVSSKIL